MLGNNKGDGASREKAMERAVAGLANVLALVLAFIGTPPLAGATNEWAVGYMAENYGQWLAGIGGFLWFGLLAVAIYFFCKVALMQLIKMANFYGLISMPGR